MRNAAEKIINERRANGLKPLNQEKATQGLQAAYNIALDNHHYPDGLNGDLLKIDALQSLELQPSDINSGYKKLVGRSGQKNTLLQEIANTDATVELFLISQGGYPAFNPSDQDQNSQNYKEFLAGNPYTASTGEQVTLETALNRGAKARHEEFLRRDPAYKQAYEMLQIDDTLDRAFTERNTSTNSSIAILDKLKALHAAEQQLQKVEQVAETLSLEPLKNKIDSLTGNTLTQSIGNAFSPTAQGVLLDSIVRLTARGEISPAVSQSVGGRFLNQPSAAMRGAWTGAVDGAYDEITVIEKEDKQGQDINKYRARLAEMEAGLAGESAPKILENRGLLDAIASIDINAPVNTDIQGLLRDNTSPEQFKQAILVDSTKVAEQIHYNPLEEKPEALLNKQDPETGYTLLHTLCSADDLARSPIKQAKIRALLELGADTTIEAVPPMKKKAMTIQGQSEMPEELFFPSTHHFESEISSIPENGQKIQHTTEMIADSDGQTIAHQESHRDLSLNELPDGGFKFLPLHEKKVSLTNSPANEGKVGELPFRRASLPFLTKKTEVLAYRMIPSVTSLTSLRQEVKDKWVEQSNLKKSTAAVTNYKLQSGIGEATVVNEVADANLMSELYTQLGNGIEHKSKSVFGGTTRKGVTSEFINTIPDVALLTVYGDKTLVNAVIEGKTPMQEKARVTNLLLNKAERMEGGGPGIVQDLLLNRSSVGAGLTGAESAGGNTILHKLSKATGKDLPPAIELARSLIDRCPELAHTPNAQGAIVSVKGDKFTKITLPPTKIRDHNSKDNTTQQEFIRSIGMIAEQEVDQNDAVSAVDKTKQVNGKEKVSRLVARSEISKSALRREVRQVKETNDSSLSDDHESQSSHDTSSHHSKLYRQSSQNQVGIKGRTPSSQINGQQGVTQGPTISPTPPYHGRGGSGEI